MSAAHDPARGATTVPAPPMPKDGEGQRSSAAPRPPNGEGVASSSVTPAASPAASPVEDPILGTTIAGRYRVEARLGEGGMGSVYRVEHTAMRKKLALKLLHREMTRQPEMVARFEREALAAAHIEHPNVAGATDFGKLDDGLCFLVLEYVEGVSLRSLVDQGPLEPRRAVHITRQVLSALRRAHELGIVHRDLKPENVQLVEKDGDPDFVKVLDFGIARVPIGSLVGGEEGTSLTRSGMVYGTPEYMAPEQALGQEVDGRSDLYATGVILFEMLTGKRPYDNKDKVALLGQHVAGTIPSARARAPGQGINDALDAVVARLMAKSPSDRLASAAEAIEALDALDGEPPRSITMPVSRSLEAAPTPNEQTMNAMAGRATLVGRAPARNLWIGAALGGVAFVVLLVVLFGRGKKPDDDVVTSKKSKPTSTLTAEPTNTPLQPAPELKPRVQAALGKVTAGDVEGGLKDLEALGKEGKGDPVVQIALAQAYLKAKRPIDALAAIKQMLTAHPEAATEAGLDPIFDEALAQSVAVDAAFKLLENEMKGAGGKVLYQIAYGGRGPASLSARAKKSLADPEVQASLSPALKGALELRSMPFACKDKRVVIEKWKDQLDGTALPVLKPLTKTTGCGGFFKRDDCWPCLREDRFLEKVIQGIEDRAKSK